MCLGGGDGGARDARVEEEKRALRVRSGADRIKGTFSKSFTPEFFKARERAYLDYALPQVEQQYSDAQRELSIALARSGILDSSASARKNGDAAREYGLRRQEIADKARASADDARSRVEGAKGDLLSLNNSLADPDQALNIANARAASLEGAPEFQPLGTLFQNATAGIATLADAERRRTAYQGVTNFGYGTSSAGAGRMVR